MKKIDIYNKYDDLIKSKKIQVVDHKDREMLKKNKVMSKSFIL